MNMADMFGQLAEMQNRIKTSQEQLATRTVTAEVGGGMVKVTANGVQRVTAIKIDRAALGEDDDMLEDLLVSGVNKALEQASRLAQEEMQRTASSMLPGLDLSKMGL